MTKILFVDRAITHPDRVALANHYADVKVVVLPRQSSDMIIPLEHAIYHGYASPNPPASMGETFAQRQVEYWLFQSPLFNPVFAVVLSEKENKPSKRPEYVVTALSTENAINIDKTVRLLNNVPGWS